MICWAPRKVWNPSLTAILSYSNTQKHWRKCTTKSFFPLPLMQWKTMLPANVLKMPFPRQIITSFWCHKIMFATGYDIRFCDGPEMLISKTAKLYFSNSIWIALIKHWFVMVTCLLLACHTDFYAITVLLITIFFIFSQVTCDVKFNVEGKDICVHKSILKIR